MNSMPPALIILLAYLIGSVPFGYLIVKLRGEGDIRQTGSGGTGATNVTRRAGRAAGVLTLLLDAAKGALAVALARWFLTNDLGAGWWVAGAALAAIAGHVFPVWLGFRGGKGVATGLGAFVCLAPLAVLAVFVWLFGGRGAATTETTALTPLVAAAFAGAALIIFMHRANIGRLLR